MVLELSQQENEMSPQMSSYRYKKQKKQTKT